jgi:hypothetical protein
MITFASAQPAPTTRQPHGRTSRGRSPWAATVASALAAGAVLSLALVTWSFVTANRAENPTQTHAGQTAESALSDRDRAVLSLPDEATDLFHTDAAGAVVTAIAAALPDQTQFTQVSVYPDYAVAVALDADQPTTQDQYAWRAGRLGTASPRPSSGDLHSLSFRTDQVDWSAVAALAAAAPGLTQVQAGMVTHVIVDRSMSTVDLPITIRVYVSGPTSSGFIEASATGTVIAVH